MVSFIKKDGTERKMCVQPAAAQYRVKGDSAAPERQQAAKTRAVQNPNLLNVWDCDRKAFRSINMDTVTRVACNGKEYLFV